MKWVLAPTSLAAMMGSAPGGFAWVNLPQGRNLVGAKGHPCYVCADTDVLATLPEREWVCGWAEALQTAAAASGELFAWLGENAEKLAAHDDRSVREAIWRCVAARCDALAGASERDCAPLSASSWATGSERDLGPIAGYGAALGAALERQLGYDTVVHAACLADGMRFAARLGVVLCDCPMEFVQEQDRLLAAFGLDPLPDVVAPEPESAARFLLPCKAGDCREVQVERDVLLEHLAAWSRARE